MNEMETLKETSNEKISNKELFTQIICRTCLLEKNDMKFLYDATIPEMLMECTSVKIDINDSLPNLICIECLGLLRNFFSFKKKCQESDEILRQSNLKIKEENFDETDDEPLSKLINVKTNVLKTEEGKPDFKNENYGSDDNSFNDNFDCNVTSDEEIKDDPFFKLPKRILLPDGKERYQCDICNRALGSAFSLERHLQTHSLKRSYSHNCPTCKKGFYEKGNLLKHMRRHEGNRRYKCTECTKSYYEMSGLAKHIKERHKNIEPVTCSTCDQTFMLKEQLDQHLRTHGIGKTHVCDVCGKTFVHNYLLKRHYRSHTGEQPYQCKICGKSFKQAYTLAKHTSRHLGMVKKTVCNICGLEFVNMRMHMMTHSSERPHKCLECGKGLRTTVHLREHMRKHTGEKKIPNVLCTVCGKKLLDTSKLRIHMRVHTGERPYRCEDCGRTFARGHLLTVHSRSHTKERPFACGTCSKTFRDKNALRVHSRVHSGIRPYRCQLCDKGFAQSYSLKLHLRSHTGLMPSDISSIIS